eukprot:1773224-Pyramimonas_sp.AAC.1
MVATAASANRKCGPADAFGLHFSTSRPPDPECLFSVAGLRFVNTCARGTWSLASRHQRRISATMMAEGEGAMSDDDGGDGDDATTVTVMEGVRVRLR